MLKLTVRTDNAAFQGENLTLELARILHEAAETIGRGHMTGTLRDLNGNTVGEWAVRIPRKRN